MESGALSCPHCGTTRAGELTAVPGHPNATGADQASGPAEGRRDQEDFTSVVFDSSEDEPPTKNQGTQTMAPPMVNEMTQYSDPNEFESETDTDESTNSSLRPIFSMRGTRRRRLRISDWLMPDPIATEDSIQYTGNGHVEGRAAGPANDHTHLPQ